MVSIAMVTIRRFSSQAESTGRHPALCCLWCIHSDRPLSGGAFFVREKAVLLSVKFLTVRMVDACLSEGELLKKFCMVNPPERRGISAQVFLLYPFCAGSGADTELTGRHPASCIWLTDT